MKPNRVLVQILVATACLAIGLAWSQSSNPLPPATSKSAAKIPDATWQNLSAQQKIALAPLAPHWAQLSVAQKNKWVAVSNNFDKLPANEQATLQDRMANWASLSPNQRAQARLSFNETKSIGADDKKTQWEAYQALSPEEKKKLAAQQKTGIQGAATASQAPSPNKVIRLPNKAAPTVDPNNSTTGIVIDKKTLLPTTVTIPEGT